MKSPPSQAHLISDVEWRPAHDALAGQVLGQAGLEVQTRQTVEPDHSPSTQAPQAAAQICGSEILRVCSQASQPLAQEGTLDSLSARPSDRPLAAAHLFLSRSISLTRYC